MRVSKLHTVGLALKHCTRSIEITTDKTECERLVRLGYRLVHEPGHREKSPFELWVLYLPYQEREVDKEELEGKVVTVTSNFTEAEAEMLRNTWTNCPRINFIEMDTEEREGFHRLLQGL